MAGAPSPAFLAEQLTRRRPRESHLENEVADLRKEVADLKEQLAIFRKQFE